MTLPVQQRFRPTLADLAAPRWRALPRLAQIGAGIAGLLVIALIIVLAVGRGAERRAVVVPSPTAFNLLYDSSKLDRIPTASGTSLVLRTPQADPDPENFSVRPVTLPSAYGTPGAGLPLYATQLIDRMRRDDPSFVLRGEGRARINDQPGYQIQFQTNISGRTAYGRRTLLFAADDSTADGADITIIALRSRSMPNVDAVGSNGPTKLPYRSFRLGLDRP
ncbi:unannotated protein [freshwater metagenome]|uniref:Unannotated protein n=1 Tax=freshwater metagenome TaxID=449393 RepID=A0A6J7DPR6_9ZZZZ|nr:hypothetical protein [Actinomycetota bacterium]